MNIEVSLLVKRESFTLDAKLSIPSRGVTTIFGPSGCGKTTLLRAIAGLEPSAKGSLKIGDEVWQDTQTFLPPHKRPLAYVFQETSLFPHLSVRGNLEYGFKRVPKNSHTLGFSQVVEMLGVGPFLDRHPSRLSGGEQQRVAIARALLTSPRVVLMDEPLAALDLQSKQEIFPFLENLHRELSIPILYVTHHLDEVKRLSDHLVLLEKGRVKSSGSIAEVLKKNNFCLSFDDTTIFEAHVIKHDKASNLTFLKFEGQTLSIPRNDLSIGEKVRLRLEKV